MRIGISGAQGSFSEEAARRYQAKHLNISQETPFSYLVSVENVLTSLEKGDVDIAIFPIENSNGGVVIEAVHAMAGHVFSIERLFEIEVHHNLLVRPGVKPSEITTISSHDQALKQCRMYTKRHWPTVELKEYADTAQAAKDLGEGAIPVTTAVIAPAICADMYGLEILEGGIQDLKFNYTTFVAARNIQETA